MPGQQVGLFIQPIPDDAPALPGRDFTHPVSTEELTKRLTKTCKQYLSELRFGTGHPAATYNTVIDTRLQLIGNTNCIKLPILQHSVISLDPHNNRYLLNGYPSGTVRMTDLCSWPLPEETGNRSDPNHKPILDFSWCKTDARLFVTASSDGHIKLWDTDAFDVVESWKVSESLTEIGMHLSKASHVAVAFPGHYVSLIDPITGDHTHQITWKDHNVTVVQWHPRDYKFLFCGSTQGQGAMFDIRSTKRPVREVIPGYGGSENLRMNKYMYPIAKAKFTTDGTKLVWLDKENVMRVFKMEDGTEETAFKLECADHYNRTRYHFDLIEEGSEYRAIVPYDNNMSIVSLSANPPNRYFKHIETGFIGYVTGAKYRKRHQHIVAVSTDNHCNIFTPSTDGQPEAVVEELQQDQWSSDED
uniref:WD_REPEATS_REGION domain-containing protein n=1 Tax=Panagrellus redivivus TaxID=6233 RepID=A0A7E4ZVL7_PANRE